MERELERKVNRIHNDFMRAAIKKFCRGNGSLQEVYSVRIIPLLKLFKILAIHY